MTCISDCFHSLADGPTILVFWCACCRVGIHLQQAFQLISSLIKSAQSQARGGLDFLDCWSPACK